MNRIFSFMAGALCGALVGSVAALLLAPAAGAELRATARERVDHLVDDVRHAATERRAQLEERLTSLKAPQPAA